MSVTPNLGGILKIISDLDQGVQANAAPDTLLGQTLPAIVACIPQAYFARVYRLSKDTGFLQTTTHHEQASEEDKIAQVGPDIVAQALDKLLPVEDSAQGLWIVPLHTGSETLGMLEVRTKLRAATASEVTTPLQLIAHHMALALYTIGLRDLMQRQASASAALGACGALHQMALALAQHMLTGGQFVSVLMLDFGGDGLLTALRTVASANRQRSFEAEETLTLTLEELGYPLKSLLESARPVLIGDLTRASGMNTRLRKWLAGHNVTATCCLPLRHEGRVYGMVNVNNVTGPLNLNQDEIGALQSLVDEMSALLQRPFDETARSLTERQAAALSALTPGQDYPQMVHIMAEHLLYEPGQAAVILEVVRDARKRITGLWSLASADPSGRFRLDEALQFEWRSVGEGLRAAIEAGEQTVIDALDGGHEEPLGEALYSWLQAQGVRTLLSLPMVVNDRASATLFVLNAEERLYTPEELKAFAGLAQQMASLAHVRRVLEQAMAARDVADSLLLASRLIMTSETYREMALSLIRILPETIQAIAVALFDHSISPQDVPYSLEIGALASRSEIIEPKVVERFAPDEPRAAQAIHALFDGDLVMLREPGAEDLRIGQFGLARLDEWGITHVSSVGLRVGARLLGLLVFGGGPDLPRGGMELDKLQTMADQVAITLENRALLHQTTDALKFVRDQYDTTSTIYGSDDPVEIVGAMTTFVKHEYAHVELGLLDGTGDEPTVHIVAEVGRDGAQPADRRELLSHYPAAETLPALETLYIPDVGGDQFLNGEEKAWLAEQRIGSLLLVPLVVNQRLTGIILFGHPTSDAEPVSGDRLRALRSLADQAAVVFENQALLRDTQRSAAELGDRVRVLQTMNQLATVMNAVHDEQPLLDESARAMVAALGVDHCGILLIDAAGKTGTIVTEFPSHGARGLKFAMTNNPLLLRMRLRQPDPRPLLLEDIDTDPRLEAADRQAMQSLSIKQMLLLPLILRGRLIGSIGLDLYYADRAFTAEMMDVAQTIAAQVAVGLDNLRLLTEAQQRVEQLQRITAFGQSVQATLDMGRIFETALPESARMVGLDAMSVTLYEPQRDELRTVARYEGGRVWLSLTEGEPVATTGTLVGRVWQSREMLHVPEADDLAMSPFGPEIQSLLLTPIVSRGRMLGTVNAGSMKMNAFSDTDIAVFQQIVSQMAIAMENAEVYTQSQRQAKNEALVNDISTQLQRQMDIHSMLNITMNELGHALGARKARIHLGIEESDGEEQ